MFTGIIQAQGKISRIEQVGGDKRMLIEASGLGLAETGLGDSIAVCGVCLTVVEFSEDGFWTDVSAETLSCTTLGEFVEGDPVNLEKSLTPQAALGGHLVAGHVDGVAEVIDIQQDARSTRFLFRVPEQFARYIAPKGSVCIDGTSLTVNHVDGADFDINIIPHTLENTLFGRYAVGSQVNFEVDIIARYLERLSSYKLHPSE